MSQLETTATHHGSARPQLSQIQAQDHEVDYNLYILVFRKGLQGVCCLLRLTD